MSKISIIGASGHAKVIIEIAEETGYSIDYIFDEDVNKTRLLSYQVFHTFEDVPLNSIIAIGNNKIRKQIATKLNLTSPILIHPKSSISKYCEIGNGTVVMAGVSINTDAKIGNHCIINTNSSIDHDCDIKDYVHISPNVCLAGDVEIGECTHIGIGACVIQGIKIGSNCIIGAGSVVIRDVPDNVVVVGNPSRFLKNTII